MQDRGEWLDYDIRIGPEKKRDRKNAKRRDQNAEKECCWGWFTWSELITVIYWTNKFLVDRWISRVSRAHFDAAAPLKMRKCGEDGRNRIMRPFFFFFSTWTCPLPFFLLLFSSLFLSSIQPRSGSSKFGCRRIERRQIRFGFEGKKESRGEKGPAINARVDLECVMDPLKLLLW